MSAAPSEPPTQPTLAAALAAWDAGLCVVRVNADGTKTPIGKWKQWQTNRPPRETVARWFADGHPGMGVLTGAVSGNLEMLELEGLAVHDGVWQRFLDLADTEGLGPLVDRIITGYSETSPSAGVHLFYKIAGEALGEGNRKLARRNVTTTLIETRGEGGFVVVAPSHGGTHPTGEAWIAECGSFATIATITADERLSLFELCERFDEMTAADVAKPLPVQVANTIRIARPAADSEHWMQAVIDELARRTWADILGAYGWTHAMTSQGVDYWRRPGKDDGWSATTNAKGTDRMIVFSSNTPFVEYTGRGLAPSYDRLDVIATYSHGGDRVAAARTLAGRDTLKPTRTGQIVVSGAHTPPAHIDPETGEIIAADGQDGPALLPEEFWQARQVYEHIRTAARARLIAPDALFGAVLARVALMTDHRFILPPIIGRYGTLDFLLGLSGPSGAGKGSTLDTSAEVLPASVGQANDYRTTTAPVGSGEGMTHAYYEPTTETVDGKKKTVYRRKWEGILFRIDEGQTLSTLAQRSGQTTMTTLRSAWSGEGLGGSYASADKKVTLEPRSYRFVGVMGIQPALAKDLLADHIGGTPQRFVWLSMLDPHVPDDTPEWPGVIPWQPPAWTSRDASQVGGRMSTVIAVDEVVTGILRAERRDKLRTGGTDDDHAALRRLKLSALLAILDERLNVTPDDWRLAGMVADTSTAAVEGMRRAIDNEAERVAMLDAAQAGRRARAAEHARAQVANETDRVARTIARHVHKHHGECSKPCVRRCVTQAVRSDLRAVMPDGIARAVALGWVVEDENEGLEPGESRPA